MNKADLVNEVAKVVKTKKEAQDAVDRVFSAITGALRRGEAVTLVGFGTFKVQQRKARQGRESSNRRTAAHCGTQGSPICRGKSFKRCSEINIHRFSR